MHIGDSGLGRRKKGSRGKRHHANEEVALQITSMADIFTILLVFLLKSYSVSAMNVNVSKDMKLPAAKGTDENVEAMKIEITADAILVEGQPVLVLKNYEAALNDISVQGVLNPLVKALEKERLKQRTIATAVEKSEAPVAVAPGTPPAPKKYPEAKLLVIADKRVPYKTLKLALASASAQDYTDFKLVVVNKD